jgi:hypothetical protein
MARMSVETPRRRALVVEDDVAIRELGSSGRSLTRAFIRDYHTTLVALMASVLGLVGLPDAQIRI